MYVTFLQQPVFVRHAEVKSWSKSLFVQFLINILKLLSV